MIVFIKKSACLGVLGLRLMGIVGRNKKDGSEGKKMRQLLCNMGPVFIKFGQMLSSRPDLVGCAVAEELSLLQEGVDPFEIKDIKSHVANGLGTKYEDVFMEFDVVPAAAASVAQIYRAKLLDGSDVAVKVLRPGIQRDISADLFLLRSIGKLLSFCVPRMRRLGFDDVLEELKKTLEMEVDFRFEATHASKIAENSKDDLGVLIPKIHWHYVAEDILVMDWIEGISLRNLEAIERANIPKEVIAKNLITLFFNQTYRDGFFHADLHPGNILVRNDGTVALVDFGITGYMDNATRIYIAEILRGFISRDYEHVANVHFAAGYVGEGESKRAFEMACRAIGESVVDCDMSRISVGKLLSHLFKITDMFNMRTQIPLILFQKSLVLVEGSCSFLCPNINLWDIAKPWMQEWGRKNMNMYAKGLRCANERFDDMRRLYGMIEKYNKLADIKIQSEQRYLARGKWMDVFVVLICVFLFLHLFLGVLHR